jgi:serine/threonine protein kinase
MGEVYRARDTRPDRTVAVKVLPAHAATDAESRARFDREARAISTMNHPNICTLRDVGRQDETDRLVKELVDGETLADRIRRAAALRERRRGRPVRLDSQDPSAAVLGWVRALEAIMAGTAAGTRR